MKRVTFNDAIDYGTTTMADSTMYGTLPALVVGTGNGAMKAVSTMADPPKSIVGLDAS